MKKNKNESKAAKAGRMDGSTRALVNAHDHDPTGGFIRRTELPESARAEYVAAYEQAFAAEIASRGPSLSIYSR